MTLTKPLYDHNILDLWSEHVDIKLLSERKIEIIKFRKLIIVIIKHTSIFGDFNLRLHSIS